MSTHKGGGNNQKKTNNSPAAQRHLVAPQVHVLVLEDVQDLPEERLEEAVGGVVHGVDGPQVALDRRRP